MRWGLYAMIVSSVVLELTFFQARPVFGVVLPISLAIVLTLYLLGWINQTELWLLATASGYTADVFGAVIPGEVLIAWLIGTMIIIVLSSPQEDQPLRQYGIMALSLAGYQLSLAIISASFTTETATQAGRALLVSVVGGWLIIGLIRRLEARW
jgi:hypothetical protein